MKLLLFCSLYDELVHGVCRCSAKDSRRHFSRFPLYLELLILKDFIRERQSEAQGCNPSLSGEGAVRASGFLSFFFFSSLGQPELRVSTPRASGALGSSRDLPSPFCSRPGRVRAAQVYRPGTGVGPSLTKCWPTEGRQAGPGRERGASAPSRTGSGPR